MPDDDDVVVELVQEPLREDVLEMMAALSPRERDVLRLRFGQGDGRQRTMAELAALYGVTVARVRQIEAKALRKLRRPDPPDRPATAARRLRKPFFANYSSGG